jgi:hypothetical protein
MSFKQTITHNLLNIPGWHTNRKIVVIESDDWGSIRMPSKNVYQQFLNKGIRVDNDPFCRYDCLATKDDLHALFDILSSVKDKNGRFPVLTADAVVSNPDFEKIKKYNYTEYFHEPFTVTLNNSPKHDGVFKLWQQGMQEGIFHPQFHGREHLNVSKWMKDLQNDAPLARIAFDLKTFGLTNLSDKRINGNYMGAFDSALIADIAYYEKVITEGLMLFENIFGFRSVSFIPTRYTWDPRIEFFLRNNKVKYLQGMVTHKVPLDGGNCFKYKRNFQGTISKSGLIHLMRNCFFEPSIDSSFDWLNDCLNRIKVAFIWKKPATISMHRLNVIGGIDENNRNKNLKLLKQLLIEIIKRHPKVEFMSSDELGKVIEDDKKLS